MVFWEQIAMKFQIFKSESSKKGKKSMSSTYKDVPVLNHNRTDHNTKRMAPWAVGLRTSEAWSRYYCITRQITSTLGSFKLQFSLGSVTSCYVIMNISIAWTIDKLKIT